MAGGSGDGAAGVVSTNPDEAVAPPRQGLDIDRLFRRFTQCVAQSFDSRIDAVIELDDGVVRPEPLPDVLAQHHLARVIEQHEQDLEGLVLKANADSVFAQFGRSNVQLEGSKTQKSRPLHSDPPLSAALVYTINSS